MSTIDKWVLWAACQELQYKRVPRKKMSKILIEKFSIKNYCLFMLLKVNNTGKYFLKVFRFLYRINYYVIKWFNNDKIIIIIIIQTYLFN